MHLKAFVQVAATGSLSRAAVSLGITQPSLRQQLLRLEDEVRTNLLNRTAQEVTLTEAGMVFLGRAQAILDTSDQAVPVATSLRNQGRDHVVFAMPPSVAPLIGASIVEVLKEQAPLVRVRVVEAFSGTIREWVEANTIDLGLVYDLRPRRRPGVHPLARDELVVVAPTSRFVRCDGPPEVSFAILAEEKIIAPGPQHGLRKLLDQAAMQAGFELAVELEVDSLDTTIELVARGLGITILPLCAILDAVWTGKLSIARLSSGGLWRTLSVIRNPAKVRTHASVRVEKLTRWVLERLIAEGAWRGTMLGD